jgi:hypothetical protein
MNDDINNHLKIALTIAGLKARTLEEARFIVLELLLAFEAPNGYPFPNPSGQGGQE